MKVSGQLHDPVALIPGKKSPVSTAQKAWVDFTARLDAMAKRKFLAPAGN
jgi:hypothetical protein